MTDIVLYVELDELEDSQRDVFLGEAAGAGFAVDELYGTLGPESAVETVMSTLLGSMLTKLAQDWGTAAAVKLSSLLAPLFHRQGGEAAIEDRDTRVTFVWNPAAKKAINVASAGMLEVGGSLHLVADGTIFRWDAAAQRWQAAPK